MLTPIKRILSRPARQQLAYPMFDEHNVGSDLTASFLWSAVILP
jgi:hypothetical protein